MRRFGCVNQMHTFLFHFHYNSGTMTNKAQRYVLGTVRYLGTSPRGQDASMALATFLDESVFRVADVDTKNLNARTSEFTTTPDAAEELARTLPANLAIEPVIEHYPLIDTFSLLADVPTGEETVTIRVRDLHDNLLGNIAIDLHLTDGTSTFRRSATTDANGKTTIAFDPAYRPAAVVVAPDQSYWKHLLPWAPEWEDITVIVALINMNGPYAWWHQCTNNTVVDDADGKGVRIGIVDSGLSGHGHLSSMENLGAFLGGSHLPDFHAVAGSHGTHVAGIIGSKATDSTGYRGMATAARVFCARAFPEKGGASQGDIANAIEYMVSTANVHLINLSLGSQTPSKILGDAILDAYEDGAVCVCAAGNSSGDIEYPAAFPATLSIGALGYRDVYPNNTISASRFPHSDSGYDGDCFVANFSCIGPGLDATCPGVGIVSTVAVSDSSNQTPYGVMDGTSMASPMAVGLLAKALSKDPQFANLGPNVERSEYIRRTFEGMIKPLALPQNLVGRGLVKL